MHVYLKLLNGEQIEQTVESNTIIIGRSAKCDIVVPHEGMSRHHCQINLENGEVFITDLGSTNGVLIDDKKIVPHQKTPYALYLTCSFGAVQGLQIELEELKGGIINNPSAPRDSKTSEAAGTNLKTKILKETMRAAKAKPASKTLAHGKNKNKDNKFRMWTMNILALLILAGAVYWFMTKDEEALGSIEIEKAPR